VRITASDTGCGIPEQRIPLVFEAFYSTKDEGSGLGLPIVKETVEAAGGRVRVESEVGRGTSFEIYLPLADGGAVGSVTRGMESEERSST
jgi:signal transduction histidine kinase